MLCPTYVCSHTILFLSAQGMHSPFSDFPTSLTFLGRRGLDYKWCYASFVAVFTQTVPIWLSKAAGRKKVQLVWETSKKSSRKIKILSANVEMFWFFCSGKLLCTKSRMNQPSEMQILNPFHLKNWDLSTLRSWGSLSRVFPAYRELWGGCVCQILCRLWLRQNSGRQSVQESLNSIH